MTTTVEDFIMPLNCPKGMILMVSRSWDDQQIDVEPGLTSKAKDAPAISPLSQSLVEECPERLLADTKGEL